jgi:hypothetical protein
MMIDVPDTSMIDDSFFWFSTQCLIHGRRQHYCFANDDAICLANRTPDANCDACCDHHHQQEPAAGTKQERKSSLSGDAAKHDAMGKQ